MRKRLPTSSRDLNGRGIGRQILLTGPPRCGKTTVVRRVVERLSGMRLAGFYTQELRRENERVGFEVVGLHGTHCVLAHVDFSSEHRVGRYSVELGGLESIVQEELGKAEDTVDVIVIDEIGRMECLSRVFIEAVTRALNGPNPVLATVANAGGGFIDWVRNLRNARLVSVSQNNRDDLPTRVSGWLLASR